MTTAIPKPPKGLLLDLDGVLYIGEEKIEGAVATLAELRQIVGGGIRLVTNTTSVSRSAIIARLRRLGFEIEDEEVLTPAEMAVRYCNRHGLSPVNLMCNRVLRDDLAGVEAVGFNEPAAAVILGDLGPRFTWDTMNRAFRQLMDGARLIVLQHNRYYQRIDGLALDVGAYAAALEYATGVEPVIVGKPSGEFFGTALEDLGVKPEEALMVGDDIEVDVGGALAFGIPAVQVRTGKYREERVEAAGITPTATIDSINDLPSLIS
jgi:HAD superfamily hydrolase (TIGR01458 family)